MFKLYHCRICQVLISVCVCSWPMHLISDNMEGNWNYLIQIFLLVKYIKA